MSCSTALSADRYKSKKNESVNVKINVILSALRSPEISVRSASAQCGSEIRLHADDGGDPAVCGDRVSGCLQRKRLGVWDK